MRIIRTIDEIKQEFINLEKTPIQPTTKSRPRTGTIFDENKSVKWNKEEVERQQIAYDTEVLNIQNKIRETRDRLDEELLIAIQDELSVSPESASLISEFASFETDNYSEEFYQLKRILQLFKKVSAAEEKAAALKM